MSKDLKGKVYLIGAGPGDGGLITVKGKNLIENADVVVYDRLVGEEIMGLISEDTERINVGKNVGDHPVPQYRINEILLEEAQKGKVVVRLKGGDPFVFGRGGEELELLSKNDIEFEVVPGITSSIAAAAYAGIPVTHRDFTSSVHIITGHGKNDSEPDMDFDALVRLNGTLVFMMSVATSGILAEGLVNAGMSEDMPCAVIENGTLPYQRSIVCELKTLKETIIKEKVKSPAVIVVGRVCKLSSDFNWYGKLPLKGKRFLVCQPQKSASKLAVKLKEKGAQVKMYPCIRTERIKPDNIQFEKYDRLVFTSKEGVRSLFDYIYDKGSDVRLISHMKIACVGNDTAKILREYGFNADFIPSVFDGDHLGREMIEKGFISKESNVLMPRAKRGSEDIVIHLKNARCNFDDCAVYSTEYIKHEPVEEDSFDMITFTSKSTVDGFAMTQDGRENFARIKALCIGQQTAKAAEQMGFDVYVSDRASIDDMVDKACFLLRGDEAIEK